MTKPDDPGSPQAPPQATPRLPGRVQQEKPAENPAAHPAGTGRDPARLEEKTAIARRAVYLCLVRDGMHQSGVADRLKLPRSTVRRAIDFLLSRRIIEPNGAGRKAGAVSFYKDGPAASSFRTRPDLAGGPQGGLPAGGPAGLVVEAHRGTVRIDALRAPAAPEKMPGLTSDKRLPNGARVLYYRLAGDGGSWSLQLNLRKDGGATLQVTAPAVRSRATDAVLDEDALRARAQKFAIAWAEPHGLELVRGRELPKVVLPREYAMDMTGLKLEPAGRPGVDPAWTDGSHPRAIETTVEPIVRRVGSIVEDQDSQDDRLDKHDDAIHRLRKKFLDRDEVIEDVARVLVHQLGREAELLAPPNRAVAAAIPPPSSNMGYA